MGIEWDDFVFYNRELGTRTTIKQGRNEGDIQAIQAYPEAIVRSEAEVRQLGNFHFQKWEEQILNNYGRPGKVERQRVWTGLREEARRLYISGFVARYLEEVATQDKKAGKQPTTTPATSTAQGVTITMLNVERNGKEYVYTVRIDDPTLQYPIIRELEFDTSNLQPWKGAYGMAFGDVQRK